MSNEITTYTSSDRKVTPIVELNNFHLMNALLKVNAQYAIENNIGTVDQAELTEKLALRDALKAEVLKRLAPPQA